MVDNGRRNASGARSPVYNSTIRRPPSTPLPSMGSDDRNPKKAPRSRNKEELYGVLDRSNIRRVCLGKYEFNTWYGNAAYFAADHSTLGFQHVDRERRELENGASKAADDGYWLDKLYVCEYCFKYTNVALDCQSHRVHCRYNQPEPAAGQLVYRDDRSPYRVMRVRGFEHELFCQNLCLFGKLFLDNKSVYYNVDPYDFYLVYGRDHSDAEPATLKPMGFFSKEVTSWSGDNNLACICVFPPYQRRGLGTLLIEFLYQLAAETPGQRLSGPEFPLSPYGRVSYLKYWSKRLAWVLQEKFATGGRTSFNLSEVAHLTGFRKEDILVTLEHMHVLLQGADGAVCFSIENFTEWCATNNVDAHQKKTMLDSEYLVI